MSIPLNVLILEDEPDLLDLVRIGGDHLVDLRIREMRPDREAKDLAMDGLRDREFATADSQTGVGTLKVGRDRVVDQCADPRLI